MHLSCHGMGIDGSTVITVVSLETWGSTVYNLLANEARPCDWCNTKGMKAACICQTLEVLYHEVF